MARSVGIKITKRVVDQADLSNGRHCLWDSELKGFGIQVEPTGTKTYIVRYRPKGHGRSGRKQFLKLGRHGSITADEARDLARTVLGEVAKGNDPATVQRDRRAEHEGELAAPTLSQLGEKFIAEHVRKLRKKGTIANYEILLRVHITPALGHLRAVAINRSDVNSLHLSMDDTPTSANRVLALISSIYSFASKNGLVLEGYNPARGVEKFAEQSRERFLSVVELARLGSALLEAETIGLPWVIDTTNPKSKHVPKAWKGQREFVDPHAVAAIRLLLLTGARLREILDLRWEHVNFERGLLHLADSKTGKKTIVLNEAAIEILGQLRTAANLTQSALKGFVIKGLTDDKPRSDLHRPWRAIRRRAQLEDVRLHDLRHTFASFGAGAGLGLPIVGKLLGHSQPQTTARYAHLDADPQRRASNMIGKQLSDALKGGNATSDAQADSKPRIGES